MNKKILLLDLGLNNIFSIYNALSLFGRVSILNNYDNNFKKLKFDFIVIPGVGSFNQAMSILRKTKLNNLILDSYHNNKKILGICLGFQLLFTKSYEFGINKGLNLINGDIVSFKENSKFIRNIGWNKLKYNNIHNDKFKKSLSNKYFYHIHSYYLHADLNNSSLTQTTVNNFTFTSSVLLNNVLGVQFHPEKSAKNGLNFSK